MSLDQIPDDIKEKFEIHEWKHAVAILKTDFPDEWNDLIGKGSSYGNSTTHMSKLLPRVEGGGGAGCPILTFGIKANCIKER